MSDAQEKLNAAIVEAAAKVVNALGNSATVGANQGTAGANAATQGLNQQAALGASDTQHKTDVNVPEVITSINAQVLASNAGLLGVINSALGFAVLRAQGHVGVQSNMELDHRDQLHTTQLFGLTPPAVVAGDAAEESADDTDR
jgi:hypothetical protein